MGPVPFIALELLERGPPMLDDYRVPAHRLPDQLPAGTEAVAQLAELALLAIRLFFAFTSRGEMRRCSFSVRLLIQIQMLNDSTVTLSIIEYEFRGPLLQRNGYYPSVIKKSSSQSLFSENPGN